MKISSKKTPTKLFNSVHPGECFKLNNNLYIKLEDKMFVKTLSASYPLNAVRLLDGEATFFNNDARVELVNATIVEEF